MHAFRWIFALFAVGLTGIMSCGEQVVVRETQAACGNGQLDADEQCDDGNLLNDDACTAACVAAAMTLLSRSKSPSENGPRRCCGHCCGHCQCSCVDPSRPSSIAALGGCGGGISN